MSAGVRGNETEKVCCSRPFRLPWPVASHRLPGETRFVATFFHAAAQSGFPESCGSGYCSTSQGEVGWGGM